ncbi:hypothetical protein Tco_1487753 [Tanacetum coccineum]
MEQPDSPEAIPQSPIQTPPVPQDEDEREPMFLQPHDPDYVSEPMYPEYIPLEDEHVFPAEEQPLLPIVSPTTESPGYVAESDPEEYKDDELDPEDGPDEDEEDEEEEEEHLALADSVVVVPTVELVSPPEGTEPVTPPPSTDITTTGARITVRLQASISLPPEAEVERLLAMPTPPPSPLISLSPPSVGERLARCTAPSAHSSPPPVPSPLLPSPGCPTQIQTLKIASTQALAPEAVPEIAPMTVGEVNTRVTELAELHEHDTQDLYALLEDAQDNPGTSDTTTAAGYSYSDTAPVETLRVMRDMRQEMGDIQAELLAPQEQRRRARQPAPDARVPDHQDASRDVDSHI